MNEVMELASIHVDVVNVIRLEYVPTPGPIFKRCRNKISKLLISITIIIPTIQT